MPVNIKTVLASALLGLSGLLVAMAASWLMLAAMNFSYGLWHDVGGIKEAIAQFGGANQYKQGFEQTTKSERVQLFREINRAIHNHGEGLADISYRVPGLPEQTLLREPEVIHLQDVANLIDAGMVVAVAALLVWLVCWAVLAWRGVSVPKLRQQCAAIGALLLIVGLAVVVIGPVKVFYWLHTVLFPDNHQWFFYYQESLMSTMMFAPVLFGWIALEWLLLTMAWFVLLQGAASRLLTWYRTPQPAQALVDGEPKPDQGKPIKKGRERPSKNQ